MSPPRRWALPLGLCLAACSTPAALLGPSPHEGNVRFSIPLWDAKPAASASAPAPALASASAASLPSASAAPAPPIDAAVARVARQLAGLSAEGREGPRRRRLEAHARAANASFDEFEQRAGGRMSSWAGQQLAAAEDATVFYPFAGPDLVTAHRFYPKASRYVLVALQDGGAPPTLDDLSDGELDQTLDLYERVFDAFARRGFFITMQMGGGYRTPRAARGICGVLMAFAEREGLRVEAIEPVKIRADGAELEALGEGDSWASLRLRLRRQDGAPVQVDYLKLDLSDQGLASHPGATTFLRRMARGPTLLKAASHLPQQAGFSTIRDLIVSQSSSLVQDETGIAFHLLDAFDVKLFGSFTSVNGLFDGRPQRALKAAYASRGDIGPLPFPIGYRKSAGSALMVATRRP